MARGRFRFKLPDWSIYGLALGMILFHSSKTSDDVSPIASPEIGSALPSQQPFDQSVVVEIDTNVEDGMGTAFAVNDEGLWMTARHVVDGCSQVGLMSGGNKVVTVDRTEISSNSDTALLHTRWIRKPMATDIGSDRRYNEMGYFFGFPQGAPGEVAAALLGRHQLITQGRYNTREAVFAWAELSRTSGLSGSLGGLSGAPVLDADGEVFGVVSAEAPRRGRVYTVVPSSIANVMPAQYDKAQSRDISLNSFGTEADHYRRDRRITQVICLAD